MNYGAPPDPLPAAVFTAAHVRAMDAVAIEEFGIAGYELMRRAAAAALAAAQRRWPQVRSLDVYCGAGNNAGDGYVLARLACAEGLTARVLAVGEPHALQGDAARAWQDARAAGVPVEPYTNATPDPDAGLVVDALLGTGLTRPVAGAYAEAIARINGAGRPVLALDVPSGLDAETGAVLGCAVRAALTVTFVALKQGLFLGAAPDYRGAVELADLAIPHEASARFPHALERLTLAWLRSALPVRKRTAHKADCGRLLLVGGAPGTAGAIRLAAEGALRAGAGLVYVAAHPDTAAAVTAGRPEIMAHAVREPRDLEPLLELADGAVLGPGLGQSSWSRALWQRLLECNLPLVVDADGLNLLAAAPAARGGWILTPHPGEAARLLQRPAAGVQGARREAVIDIARRYAATVVLKGACTLVGRATDGATSVSVCDRGNPGLASGGTGDVLAGVLGGLLVQTRDLFTAARAGVLVHALAADDAARDGERGMIASDLMLHIRRWANPSSP